MNINLKLWQATEPVVPKHGETEKFLERQQNVDAILVLSKLVEPGMMMDGSTVDKARNKISSLIDKI